MQVKEPQRSNLKTLELVENYIYLYHLDKFLLLPVYPENIQDQVSASFNQTNPLTRSAPIFSYSHSGPRTLSIQLPLHREFMKQINYDKSNVTLEGEDDYIDFLIREIQAIAIPEYHAVSKMVDPPMIAVRFGNDIYCKGVVNGSVSVGYNVPILRNGKYAQVTIGFSISEVDPYTASEIAQYGSLRGLDRNLEKRFLNMGTTQVKSNIQPVTSKRPQTQNVDVSPNFVPHRQIKDTLWENAEENTWDLNSLLVNNRRKQ